MPGNGFFNIRPPSADAAATTIATTSAWTARSAAAASKGWKKLRSDAAAAAEASGLQRLVPAFQTLYNGLSEQQKRTADQLFAGPSDTGDAPTKK